ncbi:hypothetical protein EDB84DRAFT_201810 [Lactarius hengduanensis]|nr:hypothetical protein EDB84DRAFT_201810 [Lactarius hengduanensis]
MATCTPTPTLTLFTTVTSTNVITTFSIGVQTLPDTTSTIISSSCLSTVSGTCVSSTVGTGITVIPGGVSTISGPLIITSIITEVNPISTIFASCSPVSSIPSSISPSSSSQTPSQTSSVPSFTPTTFLVTTTPSPIVVTEEASSTLGNGVVTVITVISTSTPPPSVVALSTSIVATPSQSQGSKSSIAIAPIVGGAVGGFSFLVIVVVAVWLLLRKCCGPSESDVDDEIVFPYPVTRDRDHAQDLDLSHEPKPYVYGLVGGSTRGAAVMAPQSSPSDSRASDGRPDSATALIGPSSGFASMAMATGAIGRGLTFISFPVLRPKVVKLGARLHTAQSANYPQERLPHPLIWVVVAGQALLLAPVGIHFRWSRLHRIDPVSQLKWWGVPIVPPKRLWLYLRVEGSRRGLRKSLLLVPPCLRAM